MRSRPKTFRESLTRAADPASLYIVIPTFWPDRIEGSVACDMMQGPCACGAWHFLDEEWVLNRLREFGITQRRAE